MNAISNITGWEMGDHPRYLWTLQALVCAAEVLPEPEYMTR